jgi:hypothetical protein
MGDVNTSNVKRRALEADSSEWVAWSERREGTDKSTESPFNTESLEEPRDSRFAIHLFGPLSLSTAPIRLLNSGDSRKLLPSKMEHERFRYTDHAPETGDEKPPKWWRW